jgi:hypothetical protein
MPYRHPGHLFLAEHGPLQAEAQVRHYADFLRRSASISGDPPVDLHGIYDCFGMPVPRRAPLDDQQGILVDSDRGLILIKEDDPWVRQRFTEGHELMELLFDAQYEVGAGLQPEPDRKEQLCDRGAAELLMPLASFRARLQNLGVSIPTAQTLAQQYQTSLIATLLRMTQGPQGDRQGLSPGSISGNFCLVMWHWVPDPDGRGAALRVAWKAPTPDWSGGFIPKNLSAAEASVVAIAQRSRQFCSGTEALPFGDQTLSYVEAKPVMLGRQAGVISLLHVL